ncbi:MAG: YebC/PmpR family DNA-binding transcriptional regulator [Phycisphaerales bacterium]|nr:YebC/PmpR family DNA-binding transcriptional regulator [Planctomycetota bacterium]MCH8508593.1 YebC/PmpR family DNA-binding transcriptional regulator [Phycisphaerales bacterium]
MAGHSKWANIKHRKAAQDKKRGKIWSKCSKAIMVAARAGGADLDTNLALRYAVDEAKYANMPKDTIQRAIDKGAGNLGGEDFKSVVFEGYGPGSTAMIVEGLTDNNTRTVNEIRSIFNKLGGNLGTSGSVAFMFQTKGRIIIDAAKHGENQVMEAALEAGADDVHAPEGVTDDDAGAWTVLTDPTEFQHVKDGLEKAGIEILEAEIARIPETTVIVKGEDARKLVNLIDALEDNDDVQKVFSNADIPAEEMAGM